MENLLLPCPLCGESEARVSLQLDSGDFCCRECDGEFTADYLRDLQRRWEPVLRWAAARPVPAADEPAEAA